MTRPLLLAAAASLALSACAQTHPAPRTVFLSGPGVYHFPHPSGRGTEVLVIRGRDGRGPLVVRDRWDDGRMTRLHPDSEAFARITRDIEARAAEVRRRGEEARQRGEEARRRGEEARRRGEEARRRGEEARRRGEQARARGEELRQHAERLHQQCLRGEIRCQIIENGVVIIR